MYKVYDKSAPETTKYSTSTEVKFQFSQIPSQFLCFCLNYMSDMAGTIDLLVYMCSFKNPFITLSVQSRKMHFF